MVLDPTALPTVAKEKTLIERINKVGKQNFADPQVVLKGPVRLLTVLVAVPLDAVDLAREWESAIGPLVQKGILLQEIARADITEDPGELYRISAKSSTEFRIDRKPIIIEPSIDDTEDE